MKKPKPIPPPKLPVCTMGVVNCTGHVAVKKKGKR